MGTLYIVATPIGNTRDITARAIETLKNCAIIAAEDTRVAGKLLQLLGIGKKEMLTLHQHSDERVFQGVVKQLLGGKDIAVVTDAGTPGIADPGGQVVEYVSKQAPDISIVPIPGVSAVNAALSACGFPADKFVFLSFPPHKNKRKRFFERVAEFSQECTVVLFESNHRIKKTLSDLQAVLAPQQELCIARELTKKFETIYRTTTEKLDALPVSEKGEFVIVIRKR